jgi:hypothetical protein
MTMTVGGFIFLGSMESFIFVPLMPIIIEALQKERKSDEPISEAEEEALSDKASSIF